MPRAVCPLPLKGLYYNPTGIIYTISKQVLFTLFLVTQSSVNENYVHKKKAGKTAGH